MLDCLSQASLESEYRVELSALRSSSCEDRISEHLEVTCIDRSPTWCADDDDTKLAIADACLEELRSSYPSSDRVERMSEPSTDATVRDLIDALREAELCAPEATSCQTRAHALRYGHATVSVEELLALARDHESARPGLHVHQVVDEPAAANAVLSGLASFGVRVAFDAMIDAHDLGIEQLRFGHASAPIAAEVLLGTEGTCGGFVSVVDLPMLGEAIVLDVLTCSGP